MQLLQSLWNVFVALAGLVVAIVQFLIPWTPLIAWVAFWLLAVNWKKLYPILSPARGGWIGVLLTALMTILIWSSISIPADGMHHMYGLNLSNGVGKTVYVTGLIVIAAFCGNVQLTGCCDKYCWFREPQNEEVSHGH